VCVCLCVCVCARAREREGVYTHTKIHTHTHTHTHTHKRLVTLMSIICHIATSGGRVVTPHFGLWNLANGSCSGFRV